MPGKAEYSAGNVEYRALNRAPMARKSPPPKLPRPAAWQVSAVLANLRAEGALSGPVSKREGERRGGNDVKRGLRTFLFCAPCEAGARKVFDPSAKEKRREENKEREARALPLRALGPAR